MDGQTDVVIAMRDDVDGDIRRDHGNLAFMQPRETRRLQTWTRRVPLGRSLRHPGPISRPDEQDVSGHYPKRARRLARLEILRQDWLPVVEPVAALAAGHVEQDATADDTVARRCDRPAWARRTRWKAVVRRAVHHRVARCIEVRDDRAVRRDEERVVGDYAT